MNVEHRTLKKNTLGLKKPGDGSRKDAPSMNLGQAR